MPVRPIRIAIDAHMVGDRETGNETYTLNLVRALLALPAIVRGDCEILLYTTHPERLAERLGPHRPAAIRRISPAPAALRIPLAMPAAAARDRIDLLHVTYVSPPVCGCRTVVSVHDISFEKYPEFFAPRVRLMLKTLVPRSIRRASAVITISEHTRRELRDRYGLEPDRVAVTHLAAAPQFATITDAAARADVRRRYGLGPKYLLALGNLQPRKNLSRLVHAYTEARRQGHLRDVQLVLAGKAEWRESDLFAQVRASPYAPNVIFPGYVDDADLPALYAGAFAFVYPSVYEGFGLPPLEAMACGTPVVCSNAASLPEVTGDAALSVDPHDAASITAALVRLELEPQLADDLRERGRRRAAEFTWTRCAEETLVVYRRAASAPRRRP